MEKITIAYDKETGKIIAMNIGEEQNFKQLLAHDKGFLQDHGLPDVESLETLILEVDRRTFSPSEYYVIDDKLTRLSQIVLSTDASDTENPNGVPEIKGDGNSSCELTATVFSADGTVNEQFSQSIKFQTVRGRLSARNGIVQAEAGVAKVTLTSAPETVPPFEIRAEADSCLPGVLKMEFY
jgi:hypothetical protein